MKPENFQSVEHFASAKVAEEIWRERLRQMHEEGHSTERDDDAAAYGKMGDLSGAAAVYASVSSIMLTTGIALPRCFKPKNWPWDIKSWKPASPRRMLIKAAALILAQIELIDRMAELDDDVPPKVEGSKS